MKGVVTLLPVIGPHKLLVSGSSASAHAIVFVLHI